jgi:hypothetical protein
MTVARKKNYHRVEIRARRGWSPIIIPYWEDGWFTRQPDHEFGWMTGKIEANRVARYEKNLGHEARIVTITQDEFDEAVWRERERQRFANGTYDRVPWSGEPWSEKQADHFVHMSVERPGFVAFTPDSDKGRRDRQTMMAPGRYLTRFHADDLTAKDIERYAAAVSVKGGDYKLSFTGDPDEIEMIYRLGPSSCMSREAHSYAGHCHPVRVYGGSDLQLAYTGSLKKPNGRCIVWPKKKLFFRPYGDIERMTLLLEAAGYEKGSFEGARIRRIIDKNTKRKIIMPYIDGAKGASESADGKWIVLGSGGVFTTGEAGAQESPMRMEGAGAINEVDDLRQRFERQGLGYCDCSDCYRSLLEREMAP